MRDIRLDKLIEEFETMTASEYAELFAQAEELTKGFSEPEIALYGNIFYTKPFNQQKIGFCNGFSVNLGYTQNANLVGFYSTTSRDDGSSIQNGDMKCLAA